MAPKPQPKRCAIYTRKSSEEGLEQDFNSLHAQRDSCEAFIKSQKAEGWQLVETAYDDGGFSGGSMERPGLLQLLNDIRARRIDIVVVYKIDRLTRSLADFAKMVEVFDAQNVSFVAVTQQFNTTSSMGRLTLNILLSFAQFEREVTAERIRDKIAASKAKGMWMGGVVPLGYDVKDRKLEINETEAATVRLIFARYLEVGSVRKLAADLERRGIRSKPRITKNGRVSGNATLVRGALYTMLRNPIYNGEVRHGDKRYLGQHKPIIDKELWMRVQVRLADKTVTRRASLVEHPSPLVGKVFDALGQRLTPSHANKRGRRYRYYMSLFLVRGKAEGDRGWRIPAPDLERAVAQTAAIMLSDANIMASSLTEAGIDIGNLPSLLAQADTIRQRLRSAEDHSMLLTDLIHRVEIADGSLTVSLGLADLFGIPDASPLTKTVPMRIRRRGVEMRIFIPTEVSATKADPALLKAIIRARNWWSDLITGKQRSIVAIAEHQGVTDGYVGQLLPLAFLAPDIVEAIVLGRQPVDLTANAMIKHIDLPCSWEEQRSRLGWG